MSAVILIASSDPNRVDRLRRMVEKHGAVAVTAADAPDAIRQFARREPDLTLLHLDAELRIPLEVCRDMKNMRGGRHRSVTVVALREMRKVAFDAGCDAFVLRQADLRPLEQVLQRFLAAHRRSATTDGAVEVVV